MSDRGPVVTASSAVVLILSLAGMSPAGDTPTTRPADTTAKDGKARRAVATTQPASNLGAVEVALQRLFVIPRPDGPKVDGKVRMPIAPGSVDDRHGLAHADALEQEQPRMPATPDVMPGESNPHARSMGLAASESDADAGPRVQDGGPVIYTPNGVRDARRYRSGDELRADDVEDRVPRYVYGPAVVYPRNDYEGSIYRFGFHEGYYAGRFDRITTERQERVLRHARSHLERGLDYFRKGVYYRAVNSFKLAAETNQGDPAARIYAAHALFARGRYQEAIEYLRRAFDLQPKIALLDYDMRSDYVDRRDFDEQLAALERALRRSSRNQDRLIMLGYVRYYSDDREAAYEPLAKALANDPDDVLAKLLIDACQPPDIAREGIETGND